MEETISEWGLLFVFYVVFVFLLMKLYYGCETTTSETKKMSD